MSTEAHARSIGLYRRGGCQAKMLVIRGILEREYLWVRQVTGLSNGALLWLDLVSTTGGCCVSLSQNHVLYLGF